MNRYFHLLGDRMPHNFHLPSWEMQELPKMISSFQSVLQDLEQGYVIPEVRCARWRLMPHVGQVYIILRQLRQNITPRLFLHSALAFFHLRCIPVGYMQPCMYKCSYLHIEMHLILQQNRFAKCDICVKIKMEKRGCLNREKQMELKSLRKDNLDRVE